jgi:hypothetical protein
MEKRLFTYWHQGFENAPAVVQACVQIAINHHPDWTIHLLDSVSVGDWIDPIPIPEKRWQQLGLAHRSDLIRTQLLIRYGGVWADPTVWFSRPMDEWLSEQLQSGLFLFQRPGRDRAISNWFIAAEPGNPLLIRLYGTLCSYWSENEFDNFDSPMTARAHLLHRLLRRNTELPRLWLKRPVIRLFRTFPYMIYHYAFHDLVRRDSECEAIWKMMPIRSADGPHQLLRAGLLQTASDSIRQSIDSGEHELYKLTWKLPTQELPHDSVLAYLLKSGKFGRTFDIQ